jgi:hypothetical protein
MSKDVEEENTDDDLDTVIIIDIKQKCLNCSSMMSVAKRICFTCGLSKFEKINLLSL